MKQAEAAYNREDFQQAADLFENAVRVEPANVKAKLLLANLRTSWLAPTLHRLPAHGSSTSMRWRWIPAISRRSRG